jgi:hypothetical protein
MLLPLARGLGRGVGRGLGVALGVAVGVALGVTVGVIVGVDVAVGVAVGVGPPSVTVRVTGTATSGRTGSLLPTHTSAWYVPGVRSLAFISTVTSSLSPRAMLPEAGLSDSHGTSIGGTQGAPEAMARAVCWFPWISWPTTLAAPVVVLIV